jgi:hypothetical protein
MFAMVLAVGAALASGMAQVGAQQLQSGANVNVVSGPACSNDSTSPFYNINCPAQVFGDLTVQRQNEGSMDCSSRNSANCLAAGNDYKLVGVAGMQDGKLTGDAWLGVFWTHDGGGTWRNSLLPGWKSSNANFYDKTTDGLNSPLKGLEAAADATVRAGTNGLFYVSGIAFNRAGETTSAAKVNGKTGVQFVSLYIDDNNTTNPNIGPRYIRTVVIDSGTNGQALDKPWITVDIPRPGAGVCSIPGGSGPDGIAGSADDVPLQTFPAGNVYVAYSTFLGQDPSNPHSSLWVKSSKDCGVTWSNATKISAGTTLVQSASMAVNPVNGNVVVSWREFGLNGAPDRIWSAKSTDAGDKFTSAVVANLGAASLQSPSAYDMPSLPSGTNQNREARSNDYPALCVGSDGVSRLVFSRRIPQPNPLLVGAGPDGIPGTADDTHIDFARVMFATSQDGLTWTTPAAIDNHRFPGHQFQPTIACTGTTATVAWYDQRNDNAFYFAGLDKTVFSPLIIDNLPPPPVHTVDVRAAQLTSLTGPFQPSIQVSRYPVTLVQGSPVQTKYNFLNLPLFGGGLMPFIGDYMDIVAKNRFTPPIGTAGWGFNDYANETPVLNAIWSDNRDVVQAALNPLQLASSDFTNFGAPVPGTTSCGPATSATAWTRNQNLYTASLSGGLIVQVEGNARRTADVQKRAYVVSLRNTTKPSPTAGKVGDSGKKTFRLSFSAGNASFKVDSQVSELFVQLAAFSGAAQAVFVPVPTGTTTTQTVVVRVEEWADGVAVPGGLKGRGIIAPDANAPIELLSLESHDIKVQPVLFQNGTQSFDSLTYQPVNVTSTTFDTLYRSIDFNNIDFNNIDFNNIDFNNIDFNNIDFNNIDFNNIDFNNIDFNNIDFNNIDFNNIDFNNIDYNNIDFNNTAVAVTSTVLAATNTGNVTSSYDVNALIQALPANAVMQVIVARLVTVPVTQDCKLGQKVVLQTLTNVSGTGGAASSSFSLPPGGKAAIILQAACQDPTKPCYVPKDQLTVAVTAQAANCTGTATCGTPNPAPVLTLPGNIVKDATSPLGATVLFGYQVAAVTPTTTVCLPLASGATFPIGTTTVTCTTSDSAVPPKTATGSFTVTVNKAASTVAVTCPTEAQAYTGSPIKACTAQATGAGISPVDVTGLLVYGDNTNVGTVSASVTWPGDGFHTGNTDSKTFAIGKAGSSVTVSCPLTTQTYTGSAIEVCTAQATGVGMSPVDVSASLVYAANIAAGGATAHASWAGDPNHTGAAGDGGFTIGSASSVVTVTCTAGTPYTYTGAAQTPCTAQATGVGMSPVDVSASLVYAANIAAGPATAHASWAGDGNHTGAAGDGGFMIGSASSVVTVTCTAGAPYTYTGAAQTPCTAQATGVGMGPVDVSASLSYAANIAAGPATAHASWAGDGNHTGAAGDGGFMIGSASSVVTVTCTAGAPYTYTGAAQTPCTAQAAGVGMSPVDVSASLVYAANIAAGGATAHASWAGDPNHTGAAGDGGFTIGLASSVVTVTCTAGAPHTYTGAAQTPCTAQVTGVGGLIAAVTPVGYTNNTNVGTAGASATYAGDANHTGSTGSGTFTINQATSTVTVSCPASVPYTGSAQTPCSAGVTGVGGLSLALTVSYTNNTAVGTASASASYAGDTNHTGATGSKTFAISAAATTTALASSKNPSTFGDAVTFTATMSAAGVIPQGTVAFSEGATQLGTGTTDATGKASFNTSSLGVGSHTITATFNGGASFGGSTATVTQVVNAITEVVSLSSSPNPAQVRKTVTLSVTVNPGSAAGGVPSGSVSFYDVTNAATPKLLGTAPVTTQSGQKYGVATLQTSFSPAGTYLVSATYVPNNSKFSKQTSNTLIQVIVQ